MKRNSRGNFFNERFRKEAVLAWESWRSRERARRGFTEVQGRGAAVSRRCRGATRRFRAGEGEPRDGFAQVQGRGSFARWHCWSASKAARRECKVARLEREAMQARQRGGSAGWRRRGGTGSGVNKDLGGAGEK